MSGRYRTGQPGQDRRRAKRAAARPEHTDKYANRQVDAADCVMAAKLAELAAHFNGGRHE